MTTHLADSLRCHLDRTGSTAAALERRAGIANGSIASINAGRHPRSATLNRLLAVLPPDAASTVLEAYLLDDCPDDWERRLTILIDNAEFAAQPAELAESPARCGDALATALSAYGDAARNDAEFQDWLIASARLLNLIEG